MSKRSLFDEIFLQDTYTSGEESTDVPAEEILGVAPSHRQDKLTCVPRGLRRGGPLALHFRVRFISRGGGGTRYPRQSTYLVKEGSDEQVN